MTRHGEKSENNKININQIVLGEEHYCGNSSCVHRLAAVDFCLLPAGSDYINEIPFRR